MPGLSGLKFGREKRSVLRNERGAPVELVGQARTHGLHVQIAVGEFGAVLSRHAAIVERSRLSVRKCPAAASRVGVVETIVQIFETEDPIGRGLEFNTSASDPSDAGGIEPGGPYVLSRGITEGYPRVSPDPNNSPPH